MKHILIYCAKIWVLVFLLSPVLIIMMLQFTSSVIEALIFWYRRVAMAGFLPTLYAIIMLWLGVSIVSYLSLNQLVKKTLISVLAAAIMIYAVKLSFSFPLTDTLSKFLKAYLLTILASVWVFKLPASANTARFKSAKA